MAENLRQFVDLVSKWKEENDAQRAQLDRMHYLLIKSLDTMQNFTMQNFNNFCLVDKANSPIILPTTTPNGTRHPVPFVEIESAKNVVQDMSQSESYTEIYAPHSIYGWLTRTR